MIPFTDQQSNALVNLSQAYEHWMSALRNRRKQPYGMRFVRRGEREYLYEFDDRSNNGRSLGPKSPETEEKLTSFRDERASIDSTISGAWQRVEQNARICRALQVPSIAREAGKILVELDEREMLGRYMMVAGTNAMLAYNIEAGGYIVVGADIATDDVDLLWSRDHNTSLLVQGESAADTAADVNLPRTRDQKAGETQIDAPSIVAALKKVDETYTINEERPFQLRNRTAYEVEVLVPPSLLKTLPKGDRIRVAPNMFELEWLLHGTPISKVVPAKGDSVARMVVPDPRFFALQKLFVSEKPTRSALKKNKDRRQAAAILAACRDGDLPRHPLNDSFVASIPEALMPHWERWKQQG